MSNSDLNDLAVSQALLLDTVHGAGDPDYRVQFHPDLSPLGWHLGHCVFTELFWIRETLLGELDCGGQLKELYIPERMPRQSRADSLPPLDELCAWTRDMQSRNLAALEDLGERQLRHDLMRDRFLPRFLTEHYAQHYETTMNILHQRSLQETDRDSHCEPLTAHPVSRELAEVPAGDYVVGNVRQYQPYDNEHPAFECRLQAFRIARHPVTNGEFLGFMEAGGYADRACWTDAGWAWSEHHALDHPEHWRQNGGWYDCGQSGARVLAPDSPVHGINYFEAAAFAAWAGGRLPHEYEWEAACRSELLEGHGQVWEWCANAFHPYPGFVPWPYDGYSLPYFDGRHFTLRGGSCHTRTAIRRPSFRNFYLADKRHIHAGLRLAYD